ncbi:5-formyltetrahydrofolate cyclo-ligase [Rhodobacteraceae bacterium 2376]|uniref:5-formyltetrahydrofolate cyclo-ligase n=1 Tax=Rhabdonatronobacter sediminivivens TaxID=2743469 RepID=A0A7Z0KYP5_9RHOB|nr:5-formyltetrahydrofolate cyclo-ligase [Rhabdonatronobacter sediminivivens]NYS23603.1 5-formyltetrahydrofolate cyclo-ligase [Rhabdonatronobacter sediminivivens]
MDQDLSATKKATRAGAMHARAQAFAAPDRSARVTAANAALQGYLHQHFGGDLSAVVLSGYMPMRTEIDPLPTMRAHPGPVCVPVIEARAQPLKFRAWHPEVRMIPGPFGADIPAEGAWLVPQVLIVPLLAFDSAGFRLGYGGGFYDRTLQALRAPGSVLALGLAFGAQQVEAVPREATDERLDAIITENGVIRPAG